MSNVITIIELTSFQADVRRDIITDGLSRPTPMSDGELFVALAEYGNAYLQKAIAEKSGPNTIIWFDISFDHPDGKSFLGMTWGHNSMSPADTTTEMDFFWRVWSETEAPDEFFISLDQARKDFSTYSLQGMG